MLCRVKDQARLHTGCKRIRLYDVKEHVPGGRAAAASCCSWPLLWIRPDTPRWPTILAVGVYLHVSRVPGYHRPSGVCPVPPTRVFVFKFSRYRSRALNVVHGGMDVQGPTTSPLTRGSWSVVFAARLRRMCGLQKPVRRVVRDTYSLAGPCGLCIRLTPVLGA